MKKSFLLKFMNFWPPFRAAGIHIDRISKDFTEIDVSLKLAFWNKNYVGTQYGGSLYSMTDPFFMLMLLQLMGKEYIVWDKSAAIEFKKPGTTKVFAKFKINQKMVAQFKHELLHSKKIEPILKVDIVDEKGELIALVTKTLYIKKKPGL
jgi:acyl-coenzyme A thioesterase PaaI-like protein